MENQGITNIEIKLAYLEDFMNQIQEVVVEQQKEIEMLKKENKNFREKILEMSDTLQGDIPNRKPPHY